MTIFLIYIFLSSKKFNYVGLNYFFHAGVPIMPAIVGGALMAVIALFLDIRNIISFGVLLSLFQFILISASVILLRYRCVLVGRMATCCNPGYRGAHGYAMRA